MFSIQLKNALMLINKLNQARPRHTTCLSRLSKYVSNNPRSLDCTNNEILGICQVLSKGKNTGTASLLETQYFTIHISVVCISKLRKM